MRGNSSEIIRVWEAGYRVGQLEIAARMCGDCPMRDSFTTPNNVVSIVDYVRRRNGGRGKDGIS